jgi:hypothetical protein
MMSSKKSGGGSKLSRSVKNLSISPSNTLTKDEKKAQEKAERKQRNAARKERLAERKANQEKWEKASSNICKFPPKEEKVIANDKTIKANFFKVEFNAATQFRRYRIELGKIDDEEPMNKNLRRKLIEILLSEHRPQAKTWASDYFSTIVSVEKLYKESSDNINAPPLQRPHPRYKDKSQKKSQIGDAAQGNEPSDDQPELESKIFFEGLFNFSDLKKLITHDRPPEIYHPGKDLNILNIISWSIINSPDWKGVRVGNKFFPSTAPPTDIDRLVYWSKDKKEKPTVYPVYEARTGFVTSMRPADKQLLLNVSTTTSAFYQPISFQDWIQNRWNLDSGEFPEDRKVFNEIRMLKVTFKLLNPTKKWSVYNISNDDVSSQGFWKDGEPVSVLEYMEESKFLGV